MRARNGTPTCGSHQPIQPTSFPDRHGSPYSPGTLGGELDGPLLPLLALLAGVLSCSSPCTLPLIPGYLGYMSGGSSARGRALGAAMLFVLGFSLVFTALGAVASGLGAALLLHRELFYKLSGAALVL